jgi:Domain of unknown function (DUF4340)
VKARSAAVQGGLALAGLVAAYVTWQRPKETVKSEATISVMSASKQTLEQVHFDDGTRFVDVVKKVDGEPRLWVTSGFLPGKTPPPFDAGEPVLLDGGVDAGLIAVSPPPEPPPTREVLANDRADNVFSRFMPFEATRALGTLNSEKLDELGLAGSERHLALTVAGQVRSFIVSKPISGIIGSYVQDARSGEVFLVQSSIFNELDPTSQLLVDRRLHTFKQADFDAFTVTLEGKKTDFVQTDAAISATAKVARASAPEKADELAKNWHDKIFNRLVVTEVLGKGETPKPGEPKVALRLDYSSHGVKKGWLEIGFDQKKGTWARSENTASWVSIHQGSEEMVLEATKVVQ